MKQPFAGNLYLSKQGILMNQSGVFVLAEPVCIFKKVIINDHQIVWSDLLSLFRCHSAKHVYCLYGVISRVLDPDIR